MSNARTNPSSAHRTRLLIVDSSAVCREGLRVIVSQNKQFDVRQCASNGVGVGDLVGRHLPHLVIIEPFDDGRDGVLLIKDLAVRFPKLRILAVSEKPEEVYAERILRAGASGYWLKSGASEELIRAVDTVLSGELYVSARIAFLAVKKFADPSGSNNTAMATLTDRELHVFGLIGAGHGTGRIAGDLGLSRKTIETYQGRIKAKFGYRGARELHEGARKWFDSVKR